MPLIATSRAAASFGMECIINFFCSELFLTLKYSLTDNGLKAQQNMVTYIP